MLDEECIICLDPKSISDFPTDPLTTTCDHPPRTCLDCLQQAISADLKLSARVACPECEGIISHEAIQRYADEGARQRYDDIATRQALESVEGFIWVCLRLYHISREVTLYRGATTHILPVLVRLR